MPRKSRSEVKAEISEQLLPLVHSSLLESGMNRRGASLNYVFKAAEWKQLLIFDFALNPPYERSAYAHIQPRLEIWNQVLYAKSLELVGGNTTLLGGTEDLLVNMPIDFCVPNEERTRWFLGDARENSDVFRSIETFVKNHVCGLVTESRSLESLIKAYEEGDMRLCFQPLIWKIHLIAAYLLRGDTTQAKKLAIDSYGSPGSRKTYNALHHYLDRV